ncbi:xanthine dehydrogenase family protein molybdopterin-binding subunit [Aestuariicella hydrocarbonica]|uniref:Xanthine dehydrogenase family protein molybdopterin-binding subunit n=1 Tax=Pseudomaricurvus hydrocarbonicus TaxID=1470433 RepID=A0A9E5JVJ8_9GAMM|nr:xanthine dehydrogenase family protein molybdopterin-binding subunit [Aestuariicella hydrocarbonica]NHO65680.1 xanthine dehydrogenase family protein molybdopterin-binding subunit [Aestuariicella hydrocarbonica]
MNAPTQISGPKATENIQETQLAIKSESQLESKSENKPSEKPSHDAITSGRYIGQRVRRKEDPRLLTGRGQFVDDISLPGQLQVAFARSPIARGDIVAINMDIALDVPGVHAIYTQQDLACYNVDMISFFLVSPEVEITPLANGRVAYVGEPVALVIADSRAIAEDAASLIEVEYAEQDPVISIRDAHHAPPIHPGTDDNIAAQMGEEDIDEDLEAELQRAPHLITHTVVHQRISQSPMETRGVLVTFDGSEEITLYITCQSPHMVARWVSIALGLPPAAIRVIAKDVGGGFGLKNHPWKEETAVILAAMKLRRPLKWIEDRYENLIGANQAREQEMALQIGFDHDGTLIASHGNYSCNNGAYPQLAECNIAVHMFVWAAYKMPTYGFLTRGWYTNTVGYAAYRGPWAMETLIRETALDVAARRIGLDPIEIRRRNLVTLQDQPTTSCMEIPLEDVTPAECLEKLLTAFDVAAFRQEQAAAREQERYLGLGLATYIEPTGAAGAITTMTGELAQVRIEPTGKVTATMSTHSQGHGTATTMAQIFADRLGVAYEDVTVFEGDSSRGGFSPGAAGSRQGVIAGGAAIKAAELLADKTKLLASHLLDTTPDNILIDNGMVSVAGQPDKTRSLADIANIAYGEPDRLPEDFEPGLEAQYRYQPPPMTFSSAANACVVEVDSDTGFVKILRWISSEDCGTPINPAIVEGQISGGLAQAIGMVLLEEVGFDERGNPTTATYKDYHLPAISDVPDFEFVHANTPSQSVGGMRGVGEGGAIIGAPALVNAIADALSPFGEVPVELPLTPVKLLSVIEGRDLSRKTAAPANTPAQEGNTSVAEPVTPATAPEPAIAPATATATNTVAAVIDGDWKMILSTPMGPQEISGHFETQGDLLSGYLSSPEGQMDFSGTAEGNNLKFDLKVQKPMKITLKYNLTVDGDKLAGKCKMGIFGSAKVSGERA